MLARSLVLLACFAGGAGLVARAERREGVPPRTSFDQFPMQIDGWSGRQEPPFADEILAILGVDDYLIRAYSKAGTGGLGLYIGYYGSQRQGDTMHSPLNCLPGSGWEPVSNSRIPINVTNGRGAQGTIQVNRYVVQKGLERQLVLYWYQSHGRVVASEYWSKFYQIRDAVRLNRTDGSLVRVTTPILERGEGPAEATATQFVQSVFPVLGRFIPE